MALAVPSIMFMAFSAVFEPAASLCCLSVWLVAFIAILLYDRQHWGVPGPETHGMYLSSKTRNLGLGDCEMVGVVMGSCVKARNIFSAARAESRSIVGGEAIQYTSLVEECRNIALNRMCQRARLMGCNGVVGLRLITTESLLGATEFIAYGTAVKIKGLRP